MERVDDQYKALLANDFQLEGKNISMLRWTASFNTLPSSWFIPSLRWITFLGFLTIWLPMRLWALYARILEVNNFAKYGSYDGRRTSLRIGVKKCDVHNVPQITPLVDIGRVVYPIKVVISKMKESHKFTIILKTKFHGRANFLMEGEVSLMWCAHICRMHTILNRMGVGDHRLLLFQIRLAITWSLNFIPPPTPRREEQVPRGLHQDHDQQQTVYNEDLVTNSPLAAELL